MAKKKKSSSQKNPIPKKVTAPKAPFSIGIPSQYLVYGVLALLGVFVIMVRMNFLEIPFERDEGDYAYLGQLLLDGKTPYLDFYEQKPPGLFFSYAFIIAIFGASLQGLHTGFLLVNLLTVVMMFFLGKEWMNAKAGLVAAGSFALLSLTPGLSGFTTQSEHLIALTIVTGLYFLGVGWRKNKLSWLIGAGAVLAWGFLIKQNGIFFVALGGLLVLLKPYLEGSSERNFPLKEVSAYILGSAIPVALVSIYLLASGAFSEFLFWIYDYPKRAYVSEITFSDGIGYFQYTLGKATDGYLILWILAAIGLLAVFFQKKNKFLKFAVPVFFGMGLLSIAPGYRFYGHYWLHFIPAVAFSIAALFYTLQSFLGEKIGHQKSGLVLGAVFAAVMLINMVSKSDYYFQMDENKLVRSVYGRVNPFVETKVIGDYLKGKANEGDEIAILGSEPQLYIYTGMRSPSKHNYVAFTVSNHPKNGQWQDELMNDITEKKPRFFVYYNNGISWLPSPKVDNKLLRWFKPFLAQNYTQIGFVDSPKRKESTYAWGEKSKGVKQTDEEFIVIFERNAE